MYAIDGSVLAKVCSFIHRKLARFFTSSSVSLFASTTHTDLQYINDPGTTRAQKEIDLRRIFACARVVIKLNLFSSLRAGARMRPRINLS